MKKIYLVFLACALSMSIEAQTLNVRVGGVNYQFPASKTGNMTFENGNKLTVMDKGFTLSDLKNMAVNLGNDEESFVNVSYAEESEKVSILTTQIASDDLGYDKESNQPLLQTSIGGILLNFKMEGIDHVEIERGEG